MNNWKNLLASCVVVASCWSFSAQASSYDLNDCALQAPWGWPVQNHANHTTICRQGYALLHDNQAKIASWVVYTLEPKHAIGCEPRTNNFSPDKMITRGNRSEITDYRKSGYDMGHIANAADMSWDPQVLDESFILSNIAPQTPNLNRGIWKLLETAIRSWAYNMNTSFTIYAGSIYDATQDPKIGANGVVVPRGFYKIVINNTTRTSLAFVFPHSQQLTASLSSYQTTVQTVEQYTGINFPVPDNKQLKNTIWPIDYKELAGAKRAACNTQQ